ncbi:hypothetical protein, partial [Ferrimicrobium acidiphilum]|uniref:hypothetical protein n=1 Tax=Ferrimicrobium acidiphilum TaxID=121039 RepID=UPI0023F31BAA
RFRSSSLFTPDGLTVRLFRHAQYPGWDVMRTVPPAFRARKVDVEQSGSQSWLGFDVGSAMVR